MPDETALIICESSHWLFAYVLILYKPFFFFPSEISIHHSQIHQRISTAAAKRSKEAANYR